MTGPAAHCSAFEFSIGSEGWDETACAALLERCMAACAARIGPLAAPVSILFTDDAALRDLNNRFRGVDKPTNVLSFPDSTAQAADANGRTRPRPGDFSLGDIAIARGVCAAEADAAGRPFDDHVAHMLVHGVLHLVGYDHQTDQDAEKMELLEITILSEMGIDDPYGGAARGPMSIRSGSVQNGADGA